MNIYILVYKDLNTRICFLEYSWQKYMHRKTLPGVETLWKKIHSVILKKEKNSNEKFPMDSLVGVESSLGRKYLL